MNPPPPLPYYLLYLILPPLTPPYYPQFLQVFESNAEYLTPALFATFALPYLTQICDRVKAALREQGVPQVPMVRAYA